MDFGALIQMAMGLAGEMSARGEKDKAMAMLQAGLDEFGNISLPKLEQAVAVQLGKSDVAGLRPDQGLVDKQNAALGSFDDIISGDGLAAEDRASINTIGNQAARRARSSRDSLADSMAARGATGSGADYAAQAAIAQGQNETMAEGAQNQQAQAMKRRFDAILGKGDMAGKMRQQDFGEKETAAQAADRMREYNAGAQESAQRYNLGLAQQNFQNQLTKQAGKTNQLNAIAGAHNQNAADTQDLFAGLGGVANQATKPRRRSPYEAY